eukprot:scaffold13796_cov118-Isochrysis_galbana.AAC.3
MHGPVIHGGPPTARGGSQLVQDRIVDDAEDKLALHGQADGDSHQRIPVDEVGRAVERIDDPRRGSAEDQRALGGGRRLFANKHVRRIALLQRADDVVFARLVGRSDEVHLPLTSESLVVFDIAMRQRLGFAAFARLVSCQFSRSHAPNVKLVPCGEGGGPAARLRCSHVHSFSGARCQICFDALSRVTCRIQATGGGRAERTPPLPLITTITITTSPRSPWPALVIEARGAVGSQASSCPLSAVPSPQSLVELSLSFPASSGGYLACS